MRHNLKGRKFGRDSSHRKALLTNLSKSLLEHEQIKTTLPKAKDLKSYVEKLITIGAKGSLHARRQLIAKLGHSPVVEKLLTELKERYATRNGGYTRVLKAGFRQGDGAAMAIVELVDRSMDAKKQDTPSEEVVSEEKESAEASNA